MMSLRLCALFFLALAGGSLAEGDSPRLPFKISMGISSMCSGVAVARDTVLTTGMCLMSYYNMELTVRPEGIDINDSGDRYVPNQIVFHPRKYEPYNPLDFVLVKLDKEIDGGEGFNAAELPKGNVTLTEGQLCITTRITPDPPTTSYHWYDMEFYNVKILSDAKCKELYPEQFTDDFVCVGPEDPNATYPNESCHGLNGGPLVCNGDLVAIESCEISCYGEACAYRKLSSLRDFVGYLE